MTLDPFATLLAGPAAAVLTTYRRDGTAVPSPVWYRRADDALEVVIADGDVKLRHLARCYLGRAAGDAFTASRGPGTILRLPLAADRTWDLSAILSA